MIFSFIGMPLSGKTTLIEAIRKEIDIPVLSTGDLARELGMKCEESIKSNDISMDLNEAIVDRVLKFICNNKHCIVDGFPRSEEQIKLALGFDIEVIFVQANPLEIYERAMKRSRDENDQYDIVVGRCEASMRLKKELYQYFDDFTVFLSDKHFEENKNLLVKYMKRKIT